MKPLTHLIGESVNFLRTLEDVELVAKKDVSIFIQGETGTGKTRIARRIHDYSQRKHKPFITIDPEEAPKDLFMASLLGWKKGSFTGATFSKTGKFEQVNGGTLFIDNVNLLRVPYQIGLLRVLEEGKFEKIGIEKLQKTDFRLICAANKSLMEMVDSEQFQEDLFYRICVTQIDLPPLRKRKDDILILIDYYIEQFCKKHSSELKKLSEEVQKALLEYSWPGNIRQLINFCENAVVSSKSSLITPRDIQPYIFCSGGASYKKGEYLRKLIKDSFIGEELKLADIRRTWIEVALEETNGNQSKAAEIVGISRGTLSNERKKIK